MDIEVGFDFLVFLEFKLRRRVNFYSSEVSILDLL